MRWAGHVARVGERQDIYSVLVENRRERPALLWGITRRRVVIVYLLGLLTREDGTVTLSRNVGKQLPRHAA